MTPEELTAEVERLRAENESYRRRELDDLKNQLASAREAAEHYRAEAQRNADLAKQINAVAEQEITRLKTQIDAMHRTQLERTRRAQPRRN